MTVLSRRPTVVVFICAAVPLLLSMLPSHAARQSANAQIAVPEFVAVCPISHRLPDDPVVAPNRPGASHNHTFFGATSANAFSTDASLLAGGTTCNPGVDRSSYWIPTVLENGQPVPVGSRTIFYYLGDTITNRASIRPFPFGLMMIAGNANDTAALHPALRRYDWTCLGTGMPVTAEIPSCPAGSELEFHLFFPECWDGLRLDSPDHKSHMAYASGGVCPSSHPVPVPRLFFLITFRTLGGPNVSLASFLNGPAGNAYTAHGDFFNAWPAVEMERRVRYCLNANVKCGPDGYVSGLPTPQPGSTKYPATATRIPTRTPMPPTPTPNPNASATPTSGPATCGTGANLLSNPGFESGSLSPWILAAGNGGVTQARKHAGAWSSYVGTGQGRVERLVGGLSPNTTYNLCGWFTLESTSSTVQFGVKNHGGTAINRVVTTSGSFVWMQHSLTFTTGPSSSSATLVFEQPASGGNYGYSDDWWLSISSGGTGPSATRTRTPTGPSATRTRTRTSTAVTGPSATRTRTNTAASGTSTWAAGVSYATGSRVTYAGLSYECITGHTAQTGWEPPNVPSLWRRI